MSEVCANSHPKYELPLLTLRAGFTIMPGRKEFSAPSLKFRSFSRKLSQCAPPLSSGGAYKLLSFLQLASRIDFLRRGDGGIVNVL